MPPPSAAQPASAPWPPSAPAAFNFSVGDDSADGAGGSGSGSGGGGGGGYISDAALFAAAAALAARVNGSDNCDADADAAAAAGPSSASALPSPSATFTLKDEHAEGNGGNGGGGASGSGGGATAGAEVKLKRQYNRMSMPVEAFDLLQPLAERLSQILSSSPVPRPQYIYRRELSSSTYLNRVHVVAEMAREILPDIPENEEIFEDDSSGGGGAHAVGSPSNNQRKRHRGPTCREPNGTLFRTKIRFLDAQGREWPITYERLRSAGQKHTRLSAGWRELCQANGLGVGDVACFTRYGGRGEAGVVLVEKEEERR